MLERHQLPHGCETNERRSFPAGAIAFDEIEAARRKNKKATIDHAAIAARLLDESGHLVPSTFQCSVAAGRTHRRDRGQRAVAMVKFNGRSNVQIAYSIAIGEAKRLFVLYVFCDALEAPTGLCVFSGINLRHAPWLGLSLVYDHAVVRHVEGDLGHMQEIIGEILLDDIALVAAADHEIIGAMRRIDLYDVPENGFAADLDHRLGLEVARLGNAGAEPPARDDDFHVTSCC